MVTDSDHRREKDRHRGGGAAGGGNTDRGGEKKERIERSRSPFSTIKRRIEQNVEKERERGQSGNKQSKEEGTCNK